MTRACVAANGTDSLVIVDDVNPDRSIRMNSEVYRARHNAHIPHSAIKLIGQRFTVQMDNDSTHTVKTIYDC